MVVNFLTFSNLDQHIYDQFESYNGIENGCLKIEVNDYWSLSFTSDDNGNLFLNSNLKFTIVFLYMFLSFFFISFLYSV